MNKFTLALMQPDPSGDIALWTVAIPANDPDLVRLMQKYETSGFSVTGDWNEISAELAAIIPEPEEED